MQYELEWLYSDEFPAPLRSEPYIHFWFLLRFPDVPPGKGHTVNFCFNVLEEPVESAISVVRRGFLAQNPFSKSDIQTFVEAAVAEAFNGHSREQALALLNTKFINSDVDFSEEFIDDVIDSDELLMLIEQAFGGVEIADGVTLHQAIVIDDYGSEEDFLAAAQFDTESRWQDVPDSTIAENASIFNFLDSNGFRYYLPAYMSWAVRHYGRDADDPSFFTYLAVLPHVAPREVGRGLGDAFDLDGFIQDHSFTPAQIQAIYRFICFMAIRNEYEIDEDQYAAVKKWRQAARS